MSSTYTTSLKIQQIGNGEQSGVWGSTTNTNWTLIEQAVSGVQTITMSNANYTLSNLNGVLDEARNMVLAVQGTNSGIYQVIAPLVNKMYVVTNSTSGGYAITIGGSTGSVITVPNGVTVQVYCDGTNFYSAQTGSAGDFNVNGNFTVTGNQTNTGNLTVGGTFTASNAAIFAVSPTAPTPTTGDNTTKVATTAFVQNSIPSFGTMATQNANAVAITGGTINNVTGTATGLTVGIANNGGVTSVNGSTGAITGISTGVNGQVFTSTGTFTIPSNVTKLKITVVGGGGGGGGDNGSQAGSGGGAGGAAIAYLSGLTPGNTILVTAIGAGGSGSSGTGSSGGTTTVASGTQTITTISATGGGAGGAGASGGTGGLGSNGSLNLYGNAGSVGGSGGVCGAGGGSIFGGGGQPVKSGNGANGTTGGGGGGAQGGGNSGGNGGNGIVVFEW